MQTLTFPRRFHATVRGYYRASVIDAKGHIVSTSEWRPNLILDSGLDKIAHMPWAQVFQFCVAGNAVTPSTPAVTDTQLDQPYALNSFWLTGSGNCGHLLTANTLKLYRTFDFYRFPTTVYITELGFKESPAANQLFSRIVLPKAQQVAPGQFLRVNYELNVTLTPAAPQAPSPVPTIGGWTTGGSDSEAIQLLGLCGINSDTSVAQAVGAGGLCNEPFAPGTRSFGPGYGYVNRWQNGSAVNYIDSALNPYTLIGPLFNYVGAYQNPHHFMRSRIVASNTDSAGANKGALTSAAGVFENYFTRGFYDAMKVAHGNYQVTYQSPLIDGQTAITIVETNTQTGPVSAENLTHLWDPLAKYGHSSLLHSINSFFVDPSLDDDSKSYVRFPDSVAQPAVGGPAWQDWSVAGASCFLSTNSTAPTTFGSTVDRATAETQYELPLRLDPYTPGSYTRTKYAVFDTFLANETWASIGIGPTSTELTPSLMNDAATSNGYVYVFNTPNAKAATHQLRLAFVYTWARA